MMLLSSADLFSRSGIELSVASLADPSDSEIAEQFEAAGIEVTHLVASSRQAAARAFRDLVVAHAPDLVHVHTERASAVTELAARSTGAPVLRSVHSVFQFDGALRARKAAERLVARVLGVTTASVSESVQSNEWQRFRNPSRVLHNWFNDEHFRPPDERRREQARAMLEVDDRVTLAVVGNCAPVKNHAMLFEAIARLEPDARPLVLHVGSGSTLNDEVALAAELGVDDDVQFIGSMSDPRPALWAADGFVMPSRHEGLGIAPLEAAGAGLHLLLADAPGLRDVATALPYALTFRARARDLASALSTVAGRLDDAAAREQSDAARGRFGREAGAAGWIAMYRQLVGQSAPQAP